MGGEGVEDFPPWTPKQGSLHYEPKQCINNKGNPWKSHKMTIDLYCLIPPQMVFLVNPEQPNPNSVLTFLGGPNTANLFECRNFQGACNWPCIMLAPTVWANKPFFPTIGGFGETWKESLGFFLSGFERKIKIFKIRIQIPRLSRFILMGEISLSSSVIYWRENSPEEWMSFPCLVCVLPLQATGKLLFGAKGYHHSVEETRDASRVRTQGGGETPNRTLPLYYSSTWALVQSCTN